MPLCKSSNILFPAASFPTLFGILITQLTILLLRNCHIRNIFFKKGMAEINQTGLYLQAVKERRSGVTFHFWVFQLKMIIYIRKQNLEHRIPEATYCIKAELTFVTTSGYYEKWQFVLSIISDFFLASWTFTVKVPISFIWSRFSFHIGKCSQHNEKNKKEMSRRIFFFFSGGGTFITKANVIQQPFPNGKLA